MTIRLLLDYETKRIANSLAEEAESILGILRQEDGQGDGKELCLHLLTAPQGLLSEVFGWILPWREFGMESGYGAVWSGSAADICARLWFVNHIIRHEIWDDGDPGILYWKYDFDSPDKEKILVGEAVDEGPRWGRTHPFIYPTREVKGMPLLQPAYEDSMLKVIDTCWGYKLDYLASMKRHTKGKDPSADPNHFLVSDPITNVIREWLKELGYTCEWRTE